MLASDDTAFVDIVEELSGTPSTNSFRLILLIKFEPRSHSPDEVFELLSLGLATILSIYSKYYTEEYNQKRNILASYI